jgi:hypothetical protein
MAEASGFVLTFDKEGNHERMVESVNVFYPFRWENR